MGKRGARGARGAKEAIIIIFWLWYTLETLGLLVLGYTAIHVDCLVGKLHIYTHTHIYIHTHAHLHATCALSFLGYAHLSICHRRLGDQAHLLKLTRLQNSPACRQSKQANNR
jgi:hypothetical protein